MSEVIRGGAQAQSEATSETPKFTPGPWVVSKSWEFGPISNSDDQSYGMMLSVGGVFGENRESDAHLIKASPDLYEALSALLPSKLCGESWDLPDNESVQIVITFGELRAARAALRKAEGGE